VTRDLPKADAAIFYDSNNNPSVNTVRPEQAKEEYPYPISKIERLWNRGSILNEIRHAENLDELEEVFKQTNGDME